MGLMETLDQCITAGHEMTKAIALHSLTMIARKPGKLPVAGVWVRPPI
jgi:hypothetical protein